MGKKNFDEIAALWLNDKKLYVKRSTYAVYSLMVVNHLGPAFGKEEDVTEEMVQDFVLRKLDAGLSRKTVKDILIVLMMIRRYAVKNGYMVHREIDVRFPTEREKTEVAVLSRSRQKRIMDYVHAHPSHMNLGIYICLCAGLRIGEVCALRWEDIDLSAGVINVTKTLQRIYIVEDGRKHTEVIIGTPKTATSIRQIPIPRELRKMIRPFLTSVDRTAYILTNSRHPTEPRTYRNYYKKLLQKLDMPELKFHGLRHSFATRCIESRCDYKTVSALLGHSSISTTLNLYVHPNMEQKQRCVEQMFRSLR